MGVMTELDAPRALPKVPDGVMLGYFQPNTYAERFTTTAPGLTPCDYATNRAVAMLADEIGLSFALTIGRWKGIPGESVGYAMQGFDTYSLIAALLEATERITMISTTHTGLWNPVIAAKLTLVDHMGTRILPARYSDNYLTVLPGEPRRVSISYPAQLGARATINLRGWNARATSVRAR